MLGMTLLRRVNLNLLPILRELLRKANVTHAAHELNMSQPAVSEALNRLRLILQDELLIPVGRRFVLSALAQRILPQVESALAQVETVLAPAAFDPGSGEGKMRIATSDYVTMLLAPKLSQAFSKQAPLMSLEFIYAHAESNEDLRTGEIDMIIAPAGQNVGESEQFNRDQLFEDDLVYLVGSDSAKHRIMAHHDAYMLPHIFCDPRGRRGSNSFAETVLRQRTPQVVEAARVPSFMLVPFLIEETENVALLQRRLAERLAPITSTEVVPPPKPFPKVRVMASWSRSREHDPVHRWFRDLLSTLTGEMDL